MLTIMKRKFAKIAAKTGNIMQSYIDAGYSSKYANVNAYKLSDEPEVAALITKEMDSICNMTQDEWSTRLITLMDDSGAKVSDKTRILELYGRSKGFVRPDTVNVTTVYQSYGDKRSDILSKRLNVNDNR